MSISLASNQYPPGSTYHDCCTEIRCGAYNAQPVGGMRSRYGRTTDQFGGRRIKPPRHTNNKTAFAIGQHPHHLQHLLKSHHGGYSHNGGFDYPYIPRMVPPLYQYGGGNNIRGIPPRYANSTSYELGNDYVGGYTQSQNTYIGGRKHRKKQKGGWIVQNQSY